jgi:hypothetical protein
VTTFTIESVTSAGGVARIVDDLALVTILVFLALLVQREVVAASATGWRRDLRRGLDASLVPVGAAAAAIVAARLLEFLS